MAIPRKDLKPCHAEQGRGASGEGAGRRPSPLSGKKIGRLYVGYFFDHTIGGLETRERRAGARIKRPGAGRRPSPLSGKKIGQLHAGYFFDHTIGGLETLPRRMFLQYKQLGKSFKIMKKFSSVSIDSLETV